MPLGDEKHRLIYDELVNILGPDYVSDDLAVMEAFSGPGSLPMYRARVEFIVLPGGTEDVQQIVRLANRYKFPFSISSTGLNMPSCCAVEGYPYWCFIDPKRMNRLEIDERNMYAIVEPYVSVAQVQAESMKRGLFHPTTGASTQASALATHVYESMHWTSWRTGVGRGLLGVEWVLPNGDILRTGSLAMPGAGYCWGEGPGPDARGILKGFRGHLGAFGVITRVAVKLYPWPGPSVWPTEGVQPEKKSVLPPERFKTYIFSYSSLEKVVEAIREIGEAEIAGWVMQFAPYDLMVWASKSRQEWWEKWDSEYWTKLKESAHIVAVGLWGFASEKQLDYEKKVLEEIIRDTGGELIRDEEHQWVASCLTPNTVRDTHRCRFLRVGTAVFNLIADSLDDVLRSIPKTCAIQAKYTPPLRYMGPQHKFWPTDFGRFAYVEIDSVTEKSDEARSVHLQFMRDILELEMEESIASGAVVSRIAQTGPVFSNIHLLAAKIKKGLDPNNIANPTRTINMEAMEKAEA